MESIYESKKFRNLYSKKINVAEFLKNYSELLGNTLLMPRKKNEALKYLLDVNSDELEEIGKRCNPQHLKYTGIPKSFIPKRRFNPKWALYNMSEIETSLTTIHSSKAEVKDDKYKRLKSIKYPGQIILEVEKCTEDANRQKGLLDKTDFIVCLRVMTTMEGRKYQGSQEFLMPGKLTLDKLKDRIMCHEDCQPANPSMDSIIPKPVAKNMDVNKHGMFYIDNKFYVDKRWGESEGWDYSKEVLEWAKKKDLNLGPVGVMEQTSLESLCFRLGYPYLYQHQGDCEHLIIFTDARLFSHQDLPFLEDYPLMYSFAYLRGRSCVICLIKAAKYCIRECEILPYDNAFLCNTCAVSYLYDEIGNRRCSFDVYKYVDRTALL